MQYFMQQNLLDTFDEQIKSIEEYINHIELINNVARHSRNSSEVYLQEFNAHIREFRVSKTEFEYKAIIISLYGLLENTISNWIQEHIQNVSKIVNNYATFEDKFKKDYFTLSIQLISMINDDRHSKFDKFDKEVILQKLNQSIVTPNNFELNSEAYIPTSGNLKHSKIVEAFKPLNIDLNAWEKKLHREIIKIDDLVTRRNDIAHGVNIDDAILDTTVLQEYIDNLKKYIITIFEILSAKEIEYYTKHQKIVFIDKTEEVYIQGTVCIINLVNIELKIGDILFIKKNDKFLKATILNIEKDDESVESVNTGEVGLQLDIQIQKSSEIWK